MNKLEGKVAVITGGDSGIGLATARRFIAEGAYVYLTGRRQPALETAVRELGQQATGIQGDVSQPADLDRLYTQVRQHHGRLDVLFANAGVGEYVALGDITEALFDTAEPEIPFGSDTCLVREGKIMAQTATVQVQSR